LDEIKISEHQMFKMFPRVLDEVLGKTFLPSQITAVYGSVRFQLTAMAHAVAVAGARAGKDTVYLDSGSNFSPRYVRALCSTDTVGALKKIMARPVLNLDDLESAFRDIGLIPSVCLVLIDNLTGVMNMSSAPGSKERQRQLYSALEAIRAVTVSNGLHVVIFDHSTIDWKTGGKRPIGGNVIEHAVDTVVSMSLINSVAHCVRVQVERTPATPHPGGVILLVDHKGIRSIKSA
jgi:predicted ATP-dependent serine protease